MITADKLPTLSQIYDLIEAVPHYPVTAGELVRLAKRKGADQRVIDFYRSFLPDVRFDSADDLAARSEALEIMKEEEINQPYEVIRSPQE